ncbi:hypothetical protein ABL78_2642 [Leptomonas seymouri]|uniref:Uncharacterized protein n=1 Tax=Leptomonas seymouri TaxID=5684 RepID=A0A0N1PF83_LEPSE|nr:hypothetical protein ABL78_2642 [Leptomonas seymouri]|eukprot:KPI88280.1 hypothetical protein ABL78_2642 [Leptomonas seymouri]
MASMTQHRASSTNANSVNVFFSASYSSDARPSCVAGGSRHRSTTLAAARGVAMMVSAARLQRAARLFLTRRALRRIPVYTLTCASDGDGEEKMEDSDVSGAFAPDPPPAMESRMVSRIRAELYRTERASDIRAVMAKRTLVAALREWIQKCRARKQPEGYEQWGSADGRRLLPHSPHSTGTDIQAENALRTVQSTLRAQYSNRRVGALREEQKRCRAATAIQRAWRRSPLRRVFIRRVHDAHAREVLCRQEAVERRDVLRLHLIFLVRCHQQLYNDPCMWEAGLAIRRLPLYTAEGLFLSDLAGSYITGPMQLLVASAVKSGDSPDPGAESRSPQAAIPTALRFTGPPSITAAAAETCRNGFLDEQQHGRDTDKTDAWWSADELDIDAELRYCQYRLFFSPGDRRLLEEEEEEKKRVLVASLSPLGPADANVTAVGITSQVYENGSLVQVRQQQSPSLCTDDNVPYSKAFAAALAFLRQPPVVDPAIQHAMEQLEAVRNDPAQMLRVLCAHGHLTSELVAPLACYGLHYQCVARGEEDQAVLSSTAVMQLCQALVTGVAANPGEELRRCLVGAVVQRRSRGAGAGAGGGAALPLPLVEYKWRSELSLRRDGVAAHNEDKAVMLTSAPAALQRSGFANPSTRALFDAVELVAPSRGTGSTPDNTTTIRVQNESEGDEAQMEWDHRLAAGAGEISEAWRQLLLSMPTTAPFASPAARPPMNNVNARMHLNEKPVASLVASPDTSPSAPSDRRLVGLCSQLVPSSSATPVLLRDFESAFAASAINQEGAVHSQSALQNAPSATVSTVRASSHCSFSSATAGPADVPVAVRCTSEWWDAVERLLIQERTKWLSLTQNESEQRRSIGILCSLAPEGSPATPTTTTSQVAPSNCSFVSSLS